MTLRVIGPDHVVLRVRDPLASVSWYQSKLGLQPVRVEEFQAGKVPFPSCRVGPSFLLDFFKAKEAQSATGEQAPAAGMDHFCLALDAPDIATVHRQLADVGVEAEEQFDGFEVRRFGAQGDATSIYIRDPDGYVVELRTYASPPAAPESESEQQQRESAAAPLSESKCAEGSGI